MFYFRGYTTSTIFVHNYANETIEWFGRKLGQFYDYFSEHVSNCLQAGKILNLEYIFLKITLKRSRVQSFI